jgi:hypothetical protein
VRVETSDYGELYYCRKHWIDIWKNTKPRFLVSARNAREENLAGKILERITGIGKLMKEGVAGEWG